MAISLASPYSQDFNTLATGVTVQPPNTVTSNVLPADWFFSEAGTAANTTYAIANGGVNQGNVYSFGTDNSPDRAFGGLLSGTLTPTIGAQFVNDTGGIVTALAIAYTGEQWRLGTTGRADRIDFQYSLNATSLTTGAWTDFDPLDFSSPSTTTTGALDGNQLANRTALSGSIGSLSIPAGTTVWIRWTDFNASGADDGLAVDDFSITATVTQPTLPSVTLTVSTNAGSEASATAITVTATASAPVTGDQTLTLDVGGTGITVGDYTLSSGTITIPNGATSGSVTFTIVNDTLVENTETATLTLLNPSGGITIGTPASQDVVITDDDAPPPPPPIVINELDSDTPGTDAAEFVELFGPANAALDGLVLVFYNGSNDQSYFALDLDGHTLDASGYFVAGNAGVTSVDAVFAGNLLQNGADAVALYVGNASAFPNGTAVGTTGLIDAVVYDTADADDAGLLALLNPGQPQIDESGNGPPDANAIARLPNGSGGARNSGTFVAQAPTPGASNDAGPPPPGPALKIREIQGAGHLSPVLSQAVSDVAGIVTAVAGNGFYMQDPLPDANDATSEAIFVFTNSAPSVAVGDSVKVGGTVAEFRPGSGGLTITEITGPTVAIQSSGNALPAATVLSNIPGAGRAMPTDVISQPGNPESPGSVFNPATEGIDFWESLEGMRVQINNPVATSPTQFFSGSAEEIWVLADLGAGATSRTERGGSLATPGDFNPERIQIDDLINGAITLPTVSVGARLDTVVGVVNYGFGNYEVLVAQAPIPQPSTLQKEVTTLEGTGNRLTVATFNVENLDPGDGPTKFQALAQAIVNNLKTPDILNLEEVQDNSGPTNNGVVDASQTLLTLIQAIVDAGGPRYEFRQINPNDDSSGGEPGGNIRVAFLFDPERVSFVDRGNANANTANGVIDIGGQPHLAFSPGFIEPGNGAFANSRKPLAGEFLFNGQTVFVIGNHFNSKGGDDPLFGVNQPPVLSSEALRMAQAQVVADFTLSLGANSHVLVAGDLNDFEFSNPLTRLEQAGLTSLIETLPADQRYSYNFEGNAQTLDHLMASSSLRANLVGYDVVHINSEFADQVSDHDPVVASFTITDPPQTETGDNGRNALIGGSGNDTLTGLGGRDLIAPGDGADTIVYTSLIDAYDVIVGFVVGQDKLDIGALLASVGFGGGDPVAQGYLSVFAASPVDTVVMFDADGNGPGAARPLAELVGVPGPVSPYDLIDLGGGTT